MQRETTTKKGTAACAFGALVAGMLAPAAVAHADQTDQDFTAFLQSHGASLGSADMNVKAARVMCQDLDAGYTQKDEVDQLTGGKRLGPAQAQMFVAAATADYCPKYHAASKPSK
jgi:Protein of unknown function (DUF732)